MGVVLADNVSAVKLVGNLDSESSGDLTIGEYQTSTGVGAQAFTTGNNPEGYVITGVEINVSVASSNRTALVSIQSSNNSKLYDLTGSVTSAGVQSFTAPENATLNASTTYFLHIAPGTGTLNFKVGVTDSDSEDSDSASGWSVENVSLHSTNNGSSFTINDDSLQLAVYGDAVSINPEIPTNSFDLTGLNSSVRGLWSDGETMWVLDTRNDKAVAYEFSGSSLVRDSSKDFTTETSPDGSGVDAANEIVYIMEVDPISPTAYAYSLSGTRQTNKDISGFNHSESGFSTGLWFNGNTLLFSGTGRFGNMATYHSDSGLNISNLGSDLSEGINTSCSTWGVWSDGTTMWTSCVKSHGIRAFKLSDGSRDSDRDIPYAQEHSAPRGLWSDGETMWVLQDESGGTTDKVFSYKYRNNAEGLRIHGSPITGHTLSADTSSITDPNGLPDSPDFSYQWQYDDGTDIEGATDKTYQIRTSDVGKKLRVRVSFTDNARYKDEIFSEPTEKVTKSKLSSNSYDLTGLNSSVRGLWSDGETMWVLDTRNDKAVAYEFSGSSLVRDSSKDFTTETSPDGSGVDAANEIVYIMEVDPISPTAYAYSLSGTRQTNKDISGFNHSESGFSTGLWFNGNTLLFSGTGRFGNMATYHSDSGLNISNLGSDLSEGINTSCSTWGVWSDGTTMWTSCVKSHGIRAFKLSDGSRDSDRDIPYAQEHSAPRGLWSDGETMWVLQDESGGTTDKVFSYKYRNNAEGLRIHGSPITGHTLSADIASITEPDGLPDSPEFSYQWQYADGTDIAGAISKTYYLKVADAGKKVRVRVSFTDNARYEEEIFSEPTGTIQTNELAVFGQSEYIFYLDENRNGSGVNAITLGRITVTDKNKPSGVGLFFTESSSINSNDGKFRITGETTDTFRFQYRGTGEEYNETKNKYVYTITTFNNNNFTNSTSVNVTIYINDPNEAPVFEHLRYFFYLDKNKSGKPTPVELGTITVTDNKDPDGVTLFFPETNSPSSNDGKFRIIGETTDTFRFQYRGTGEEYNETKDRYVYTIAALDNNNNIAYMNVTVLIRNSTEPPVFDQREYVFYLDVNISGPVEMGTITLTDNDDSNGITLFFTEINSVNSNDGKFRISGGARDTFRFQYKGTGETDETNKYVYTIEAIDDRDNSAYANVTIYIINPNAPVFSQKEYVFYLDENQIGNDTPIDLGTISATDNDDPDGFAFSFANDSNDTFTPYSKDNKFRIKANTTTSSTFRYVGDGEEYNETDETKNKYVYTIITSDNNLNYAYATVIVYIRDVDEGGNVTSVFDQSELVFYLDENRNGSGDNPITLGTITLNTNDDAGIAFTDSEMNKNAYSPDNKFSIQYTSGNSFEFRYIGTGEEYNETKNKYVYSIYAAYGMSNEITNVIVYINDPNEPIRETNEAPVFSSSSTFSVNENNISVGTITATDSDTEDIVTGYSISGGADSTNFSITNGGVLTFVSAPDFENPDDANSNNDYEVQVTATSGVESRVMTATQDITVTITNANEHPEFTSSSTFIVNEHKKRVGTVMASDEDVEDSITGYSISGGEDAGSFRINNNGVLHFIPTPNFESPSDVGGDNEYKVSVQVTSGTGSRHLTANKEFTVSVNDLNEPPSAPAKPTLNSLTSTSLLVNWVAPSNKGPAITDYNVQYRVGSSGSWSNWTHNEASTTTTITNLSTNTTYQVRVRAHNAEGTSGWSSVTEGITGTQLTPMISNVEASDITDDGANITVTISNPDGNARNIHYRVWALAVARIVDSGVVSTSTSSATFRLTGLNEGFLHRVDVSFNESYPIGETQNVRFTPEEPNDPPILTKSLIEFNLSETADGSSTPFHIGRVEATDPDGDPLNYTLVRTHTDDIDKFTINPTSGDVYYTGSGEDYETKIQYFLLGNLYDGVNQAVIFSFYVYVRITNNTEETNNLPAFTSSSTFSVNENNINVGTVIASDSDTEDNVTGYSISGGTDNTRFSITKGGVLTFVSAPDFENPNDAGRNNEYEIQVTATSGTGGREMSATQNITITVNNVSESMVINPRINVTQNNTITRSIDDLVQSGVCGANNNICTTGIPEDTVDNSTHYLWKCNGINGGNNDLCNELIPPIVGVCGTNNNACTIGNMQDTNDNSTHYLWECNGINGGTNSTCNKPITKGGSGRGSSGSNGGGSSGSSGGGSSGTTLYPQNPEEFKIKDDKLSINIINITSNEKVRNVKINANKLRKEPSLIENFPEENVFEYFEINARNLNDEQIDTAFIIFVLSKEEILENKDIILSGYNKYTNQWKDLETRIIRETSTKITFSAQTDSFSYSPFVISIREIEVITPPTSITPPIQEETKPKPQIIPPEEIIIEETRPEDKEEIKVEEKKETYEEAVNFPSRVKTLSLVNIFIAIILGLVLGLIVLIIRKNKKRNQKNF